MKSIPLAVVALLSTASLAAAAPTGSPVPPVEATRIAAEYGGGQTYLPRRLPRGFIFTRWEIFPSRTNAYGSILSVSFGNDGAGMTWTIADGREPEYSRCRDANPYFQIKRTINKRVVFHVRGNHGNESWTCQRIKSRYATYTISITLWVETGLNHPTANEAMTIVATSRPYRK